MARPKAERRPRTEVISREELERGRFLGFVVWNPRDDDFLKEFESGPGWTGSSWVASPEHAFKFPSTMEAHRTLYYSTHKGLKVLACFDLGKSIVVAQEY